MHNLMNINDAIHIIEAGNMTHNEAGHLFAWLIAAYPMVAQRYDAHIQPLIQAGYLVNRNGQWLPNDPTPKRRKGGRPRGRAQRNKLTVYMPGELLAEIDNHALSRYLSRNELILLLVRNALDRRKE